jgi:hypothetical protein
VIGNSSVHDNPLFEILNKFITVGDRDGKIVFNNVHRMSSEANLKIQSDVSKKKNEPMRSSHCSPNVR